MDNESETAIRFRQRVKAERNRLGWTQTELAEKLSANGVHAKWSSIAKLESGARGVRLDEAAAIADVFGTSLLALMGRRPKPAGDLHYTVETLLSTQRQGRWPLQALLTAMAEQTTEVAAADSRGFWAELIEDARAAVTALTEALAAVDRVGQRPTIGIKRAQREILRRHLDKWDEEDTGDDT
jgi:transcriptional regulator with XRE-family HTH domain